MSLRKFSTRSHCTRNKVFTRNAVQLGCSDFEILYTGERVKYTNRSLKRATLKRVRDNRKILTFLVAASRDSPDEKRNRESCKEKRKNVRYWVQRTPGRSGPFMEGQTRRFNEALSCIRCLEVATYPYDETSQSRTILSKEISGRSTNSSVRENVSPCTSTPDVFKTVHRHNRLRGRPRAFKTFGAFSCARSGCACASISCGTRGTRTAARPRTRT